MITKLTQLEFGHMISKGCWQTKTFLLQSTVIVICSVLVFSLVLSQFLKPCLLPCVTARMKARPVIWSWGTKWSTRSHASPPNTAPRTSRSSRQAPFPSTRWVVTGPVFRWSHTPDGYMILLVYTYFKLVSNYDVKSKILQLSLTI